MDTRTTGEVPLWLKCICFISLTDSNTLRECGSYDHLLVIAMFLRQLTTLAFTFLLFTYGVSLFMGREAAIVAGLIFSLVLFFLDQAIIGADWALRNPFSDSLPMRAILGFIPRLLYSLIIAFGLATLAEISIQSDAIDEQIKTDTKAKNKDYYAKTDKFERVLDSPLSNTMETIATLRKDLAALSDVPTNPSTVDSLRQTLNELQSTRSALLARLYDQIAWLNDAEKKKKHWHEEIQCELSGDGGHCVSGKGPRYESAVETHQNYKDEIAELLVAIPTTESALSEIDQNIDVAQKRFDAAQQILDNVAREPELRAKLETTEALFATQIADKDRRMSEHRKTLKGDNLFTTKGKGRCGDTSPSQLYIVIQHMALPPHNLAIC